MRARAGMWTDRGCGRAVSAHRNARSSFMCMWCAHVVSNQSDVTEYGNGVLLMRTGDSRSLQTESKSASIVKIASCLKSNFQRQFALPFHLHLHLNVASIT
eukprot:2280301-Pleurochrysis_carterae.AAC.2